MREFIKVMKALSDPNRVKLIELLQRRVLCVCKTQEAMRSAQATASKHPKILDASLIAYSRKRLGVNYRLADGDRNPYMAGLLENLRHWLELLRIPKGAAGCVAARNPTLIHCGG